MNAEMSPYSKLMGYIGDMALADVVLTLQRLERGFRFNAAEQLRAWADYLWPEFLGSLEEGVE